MESYTPWFDESHANTGQLDDVQLVPKLLAGFVQQLTPSGQDITALEPAQASTIHCEWLRQCSWQPPVSVVWRLVLTATFRVEKLRPYSLWWH